MSVLNLIYLYHGGQCTTVRPRRSVHDGQTTAVSARRSDHGGQCTTVSARRSVHDGQSTAVSPRRSVHDGQCLPAPTFTPQATDCCLIKPQYMINNYWCTLVDLWLTNSTTVATLVIPRHWRLTQLNTGNTVKNCNVNMKHFFTEIFLQSILYLLSVIYNCNSNQF